MKVETQDIEQALQKLKNRKSPGQDTITNELLKYGGQTLVQQLTELIQKILDQKKIPDEWRTGTSILMFKGEIRRYPQIIGA